MNLDPTLGRLDRVGSLLCGVGAVVYALRGHYGNPWVCGVIATIGMVFVVGGIMGT